MNRINEEQLQGAGFISTCGSGGKSWRSRRPGRVGAGRVQVMCRLAAALVGLPDGLYRNTEWRTQCHHVER